VKLLTERIFMFTLPSITPGSRLAAGVALAMAAAMALAACGGSSGDGNAGGGSSGDGGGGGSEKVPVTLITKDANNPYWVAMQGGAKAAAAAQNVTLTIGFGAKDGDEQGQVSVIEEAIARGDKGILIAPNGPGVNDSITKAKDGGMVVIALDTPPTPDPKIVDLIIATDNFKAGELIGKWAAAQLGGKKATIALLDLFNDKVVSVDVQRDQGFLTGMGIDVKDKGKNGDEAKTGKYTGGKGGDYQIVCNEPTQGAADTGKTAMENCLSKSKDINVVYTINEPSATGAAEALSAAKVSGAIVVSVDGGCNPGITSVKSGVIGATSQQYPQKMAQLGLEAVAKIANGGAPPAVTPGLDFLDAGVSLVTDKPVSGLQSIDSTKGAELCWGDK
jgi:fructose transport system substrate-binding protein